MSESLAAVGSQLGARPCPGGFVLDRAGMQLLVSLQSGTLLLDLQGSKKAHTQRERANAYRAATSPTRDALVVRTIEPIVLRPLESVDMLGLPRARHIELGDEAYDVSTAVETVADRDAARAILTPPEVRKGVFHLLDRGFQPLELYQDHSVVRAALPGATPGMLEPDALRGAVEAVLALGEGLPLLAPRQEGKLGWRRRWSGSLWLLFPAVLIGGLIAMKLHWFTLEPWELLGAGVGAAVWGLSIPVVLGIHSRRTDPIRSAARLLVPGLFILPLAGVDILLLVNCGLDRSPKLTTRSPVTKMWIDDHDSRTWHIKFPSRRSAGVTRSMEVDQEFYEELQRIPEAQRAIVMDYYPGRLGLEYYTGAPSTGP